MQVVNKVRILTIIILNEHIILDFIKTCTHSLLVLKNSYDLFSLPLTRCNATSYRSV